MKVAIDTEAITKKINDFDASQFEQIQDHTVQFINEARARINAALELNDRNQTTHELLKLASDAAEHLNLPQKSVCQTGCAHCCKVPVDVSPLEALYIGENIGIEVSFPTEEPASLFTYCPFLDLNTAQCSIYEHRPLECRTHFSFDHYKYCEQGSTNHMQSKTASTDLWMEIREIIIDGGGRVVDDIRAWFPKGKES